MIISISGTIGSGKDTVAQIIQKISAYHNWEIQKWAGKLKTIGEIILGIPKEKFEDQEFKYTNLPAIWNKDDKPMTVRELLQLLGTEAMRNGLHENVWVNALMSNYKPIDCNWNDTILKHKKEDLIYPNWIITDTRFTNELEAVREQKGITIKVHRPERKSNEKQALHTSEVALDHVTDWDYVIYNNGDLEELQYKIIDILIAEKLIIFDRL